MKYRYLGCTGLKVSEICMGTMQFGWTAGEDIADQILNAATDAGVNFIDTADVYSRWVDGNSGGEAETIIGNWMKRNHIPRHQIVLATKVRSRVGDGPNDEGLSRAHIYQAVEASLHRLGTDYIDLYQAHWLDENTPIQETLSALDDLVHQGKVRYIGCSNYSAWRLTEALWTSEQNHLTRYETLQPHYNLVHREEFERELAGVCRAYHLGVIPYSPLAAGFLTGKYQKGKAINSARAGRASQYGNDRNWGLLAQMEQLGKDKGGYSVSQIALAWLLDDPLITSPIIGPRTMEQYNDNLGATTFGLSQDEKKILDESSRWPMV